MVVFIPTNKLMQIKVMYAVLDISKKKDAGYMRGVIDHLKEWKKKTNIHKDIRYTPIQNMGINFKIKFKMRIKDMAVNSLRVTAFPFNEYNHLV